MLAVMVYKAECDITFKNEDVRVKYKSKSARRKKVHENKPMNNTAKKTNKNIQINFSGVLEVRSDSPERGSLGFKSQPEIPWHEARYPPKGLSHLVRHIACPFVREVHVFLATTLAIPLSRMGFLANGLRILGVLSRTIRPL